MPVRQSRLEEALAEGVLTKWLATIKRPDEGRLTVERMELDETGLPSPPASSRNSTRTPRARAGPGPDLSLLRGADAVTVHDGVVAVEARMMTGAPGIFAGGDMVPAERTVPGRIGHDTHAARNIDAWPLRTAGAAAPADAHLDLDLCKSCGLCARDCPCGAMDMVDEQI